VATESDLRDLLRGPEPEGRGEIDLEAVLTRTRRRRRPRVIAAQALGSVALVGALGTVVIVSLPPAENAMIAQDTAAESEAGSAPLVDEDGERGSDALSLNSCGAAVSELTMIDAPTLVVSPITASAGTDWIPITVILHSAGLPARGVSSVPVLTISRDGVVVSQPTALEAIGYDVELTADGTFAYEVGVRPVECDPAQPDADLGPLPPGEYEIQAAVDFLAEGSESGSSLFIGPPSTLVLE
jgi:hypothetical protein